jgi:hypothetical protein
MLRAVLGVGFLVGCSRSPSQPVPAQSASEVTAAPHASAATAAPAAPTARRAADASVTFIGMCDASGAVEVTDSVFAVADDEDNVIRTYDATRGGAALAKFDLSPSLHLPVKGNSKPKPDAKPKRPPETDLEAATRIGSDAYWITSHGRNSTGKLKQERLRFFATSLPRDGVPIQVIGEPYEHLLEDLLAEPRLSRFGLAAAAELAPKAPGGLNLEGMTARVEGGVFIGFRNPLPENKALVVPLLNPEQVVRGQRAKLGDPLLLELGGHGVRSLSSWRGLYLIAAGRPGDGGLSQLYTWDGKAVPEPVRSVDFQGFNPEGFFTPETPERIFVLSDDGTVPIDGVPCKELKDEAQKRFRGAWVPLALE